MQIKLIKIADSIELQTTIGSVLIDNVFHSFFQKKNEMISSGHLADKTGYKTRIDAEAIYARAFNALFREYPDFKHAGLITINHKSVQNLFFAPNYIGEHTNNAIILGNQVSCDPEYKLFGVAGTHMAYRTFYEKCYAAAIGGRLTVKIGNCGDRDEK